MADQTGDVHAAGLEVDDEPDDVTDETAEREYLDGEEVRRGDRAEVCSEEGLPRHRLAALGRGFQAMLGEDALDRVSSKLVTKVAEHAEDPGVAPGRVLGGELDDQALQRSGRAGASTSSSSSAVVLVRDELAVPAQDRVGRHEAGELLQDAATKRLALGREPAALCVGEAHAPATEL